MSNTTADMLPTMSQILNLVVLVHYRQW